MPHAKYCQCSIFKHKNISLVILAIHAILAEIEQSLPYFEDFDILEKKFSGPLLDKFIFHVKVIIDPPSQLQKKLHLVTQCTMTSLFSILKDYLGHNYLITIEMCDVESYDKHGGEYFENNLKILEIHPSCSFNLKS